MEKEKSRYDIITPINHFKTYYGSPQAKHLIDDIFYMKLDNKTPKTYKQSLEEIAWFFKREFRYDFVQYLASEPIKGDIPILLMKNDHIRYECIGGILLTKWEPEESVSYFSLGWVWVHPYLRGQGILSALWPLLREWAGAFVVEPPLSKAMQFFLRKRGECWRHYKSCTDDCTFLKQKAS